MLKIDKIRIKRFRSIMDMTLAIQADSRFISICGANNIGKTNVLRAIDLFFHPEKIDANTDIPYQKLETGSGGNRMPEIEVEFSSDEFSATIQRSFAGGDAESTLKGAQRNLQSKSPSKNLTHEECEAVLGKFICKFIEAINLSFPELIHEIVDEIYDIEYEKSRFLGVKEQLRLAHKSYSDGLIKVLRELAAEISPSFQEFNPNWSVDFDLREDVEKFRDLISDDVEFYVRDSSNKVISSKGSGLQRLAFVLLQARILQKAKNKIPLLLIDEPDAFLHPAMEKKLAHFLRETFKDRGQVILTAHSAAFIDSFHLRNVFLLDLEIGEPFFFQKVKRNIRRIETKLIDIDSIDGAKKIRTQLGIEEHDVDPLDPFNIMVEGDADKKYLEELAGYFELKLPRIIPAHGATNIEKLLNFYSGFYAKSQKKPKILVLLDDDQAGRDVYSRLFNRKEQFASIGTSVYLVPNCLGEVTDHTSAISNKGNWRKSEIEDLVYPEIICSLSNEILASANYSKINSKSISEKLSQPAFKSQGILRLIENEKNTSNPDTGQKISFSGSDNVSERMKSNIAGRFNPKANRKLLNELSQCDSKYPEVRKFMTKLTKDSTT